MTCYVSGPMAFGTITMSSSMLSCFTFQLVPCGVGLDLTTVRSRMSRDDLPQSLLRVGHLSRIAIVSLFYLRFTLVVTMGPR